MSSSISEAVPRLLRDAIQVYQDDPVAVGILEGHARRLDEPLRIAVAGMVKAGKSTLINALLGEELAPTDAGECTRTVVWYRHGDRPRVTVFPIVGEPVPVSVDGRPWSDLDGIRSEEVERVEVEWPADGLRNLTLVDTPGIASLSGDISERSNRFLIPEDGSSDADAMIYVLRHLHQADLTFLKEFRDRASTGSGTVNTLAVLSRADEIGAGRIDSLLAARDIATRYRNDETLHALAIGVLPLAGRLAQTACSLQQAEHAALVELAQLDRDARERLLMSADRFVQTETAGSSQERAAILDRFGLFGIRLAIVLINNGYTEVDALARELARRSGLDELRDLLATRFWGRASELKAQAAIVGVETLLRQRPHSGADGLAVALERIMAGAHELRELRALAMAGTAGIPLGPEPTAQLLRLVGGEGTSPVQRLGLRPDAPLAEVRSEAVAQVRYWRTLAENPLTDRATAELCRIVVRSCEGILAQTETEDRSDSLVTTRLLGSEPTAGARDEA